MLASLPGSLEGLFAFLAQEVLARQSPEVREFLLTTSVLQALEPAACDHLLGHSGSEVLLRHLDDAGLFLAPLGDQYRYHHLFQEFLAQQAAREPGRAQALHERAAAFYHSRQAPEAAVRHLIAAGRHEEAADLIEVQQAEMAHSGRLGTLTAWCEQLPAEVLAQRPALLACLGDVSRFNSRFDTALAWYEQAKAQYAARLDYLGLSRALQGQALVYLDTVRPLRAEALLQEALRLIDGQQDKAERARVLELLAENKLNRGELAEAESLWRQARELRDEGPGLGDLDARVRLRTGRLAEAREMLEQRAAAERSAGWQGRNPRSHRETLLVLSLIYAFQGEAAPALATAEEGIRVGQALGSPFVEAVGYIRRGHALLLADAPQAVQDAEASYRYALALTASLSLPRLEVEGHWGLARLFGYRGDIDAADHYARQGMDVGLRAGDEWIAALVAVTLGASCAQVRHDGPAEHWLSHAAAAFRRCGDTFLHAVARLWLAWLCHAQGDAEGCERHVAELLRLVHAHGYSFLLTQHTLLGPPDPQSIIPLLLHQARPAAADVAFKVVLNALCRALEPRRPAQVPAFFVVRRGASYGLNPAAAVHVDADQFARLIAAGRKAAAQGDLAQASSALRQALALYQGDFLQDSLYEAWSSEERERLLILYLSTACELAGLLARQEDWQGVIEICERILERDDCWEEAYRLMMAAYDRLGNRAQALRAYQQCARCLREELATDPHPETTALYQDILKR